MDKEVVIRTRVGKNCMALVVLSGEATQGCIDLLIQNLQLSKDTFPVDHVAEVQI